MHKVSDHINKNLLPRGFQNVLFVTPLGGGGNNRVFKILLENSEVYVLKKYEPHLEKENHEGLAREFSALEALWKLGFDNIPVPVFQEKESGAGIYSFISGRPIKRADDSFLKQAAEFMRDLWGVKELIPETSIAPATDHCFCLKDYRDNVEKRLNTLLSIEASGSPLNEVKQFLKTDIRPFFNNLVSDVYFRKMLSGDPALSHGQLIPSPSDFGFHNALKDAGGRVFFLDFEYFGWDDPAKLICDSLHHPAMGLDFSMRKRFLTFLSELGFPGNILKRASIVEPLTGLKWCLLILNVCHPGVMTRKKNERSDHPQSLIKKRLSASKKKFKTLLEESHENRSLLRSLSCLN